MAFRRFLHRKPRLHQQGLRLRRDLLPMLKRTSGMIRHGQPRGWAAWHIAKARQHFRDIGGQARDLLSLLPPGCPFLTEHEAVILERGAAARCVHHNRIQPITLNLRRPGCNIRPRQAHRRVMVAHVMVQRAAAALTLGHHNLDPHPRQQPDRRLIDRRRQDLLRTARQQTNAPAPFALRRKHPAPLNRRRRWHMRRRQTQHGAHPFRHR